MLLIGRYDLRWQKIELLSLFVQLLLECKSILYQKVKFESNMNRCHCLPNCTVTVLLLTLPNCHWLLGSSVQFALPNFPGDDFIDDVIDWSWWWEKVAHQIWWWRHCHVMRYSLSKFTAYTYLRALISACLYGIPQLIVAISR